MPGFSLRHLEDHVLLRDLTALVATDRATTASLIAHIGEVAARKLYVPAGYSRMGRYCVEVLRFSEDVAAKRVQAAKAARRYPVIFPALADGRLHVSGVCLLAPYLLPSSAEKLLTEAMGKTKRQIEALIAAHFPQSDWAARVTPVPSAIPAPVPMPTPEPAQSLDHGSTPVQEPTLPGALSPVEKPDAIAPGHSWAPAPSAAWPRIQALSPDRYGVRFTISGSINDKLERAKDLLANVVDPTDLEALFDRALDALIEKTERRKFAETDKPRRSCGTKSARTIPADVKRKVRKRDGDRCTFMSDAGRRCDERAFLEFDHVTPVARGGESTVTNLRLRCKAHNQYEAERAFGAGFMQEKRDRERTVQGPSAASNAQA